jgi:uncharacterized protein YvpB
MTGRRLVGAAAAAATAGLLTTACGTGTQPLPARAHPAAPAGKQPVAPVSPASRPLPPRALLHVPALAQLPELPNGCEITSLAMLLTAARHPVSKMTLARLEPRDPAPAVPGDAGFGAVREWGDPEVGFVGSVFGRGIGYGIYHRPLARFLDRLLPGRAVDLTGNPFDDVLRQIADGRPVVVWATTTFAPTDDWVTWRARDTVVRATSFEHAVLLVGYDPSHVYVNNPLTGAAAQRVPRGPFIRAWMQLGRQALTFDGVTKGS